MRAKHPAYTVLLLFGVVALFLGQVYLFAQLFSIISPTDDYMLMMLIGSFSGGVGGLLALYYIHWLNECFGYHSENGETSQE